MWVSLYLNRADTAWSSSFCNCWQIRKFSHVLQNSLHNFTSHARSVFPSVVKVYLHRSDFKVSFWLTLYCLRNIPSKIRILFCVLYLGCFRQPSNKLLMKIYNWNWIEKGDIHSLVYLCTWTHAYIYIYPVPYLHCSDIVTKLLLLWSKKQSFVIDGQFKTNFKKP